MHGDLLVAKDVPSSSPSALITEDPLARKDLKEVAVRLVNTSRGSNAVAADCVDHREAHV